MSLVKLQIPNISKSIKDEVEKQVEEEGISSLQDFIRMIINKIGKGHVSVGEIMESLFATESVEKLSPEADARYNAMILEHMKDRESGNVKSFNSVEELMKDLNS